MKTLIGTAVDLGPGHIVLDGVSAPAKGAQQPGAQQPPSFQPMSIVATVPISAIVQLLLYNETLQQTSSCIVEIIQMTNLGTLSPF